MSNAAELPGRTVRLTVNCAALPSALRTGAPTAATPLTCAIWFEILASTALLTG